MGGAGAAAGGVMGGLQILNAKATADGIKRQHDFMAQQEMFNSELMQIKKGQVYNQRDRDIVDYEGQVKKMLGEQKVSAAAQGIELEDGSPNLLKEETMRIAREDVQTIKNNAWREAMGLQIESINLKYQSKFTSLSGRSKARDAVAQGTIQGASTIASSAGGFF